MEPQPQPQRGRPFLVTDRMAALGHALAQAGFDPAVDFSPDYRYGCLLFSDKALAWLEKTYGRR